jgi:AraC-like DNA-binding protein
MATAATPDFTEVSFIRDKYGPEIPVDAHRVDRLPGYSVDRPHRLGYHEIQFVTSGCLSARLNSESADCGEGQVLFTAPHQVRMLPSPGGAEAQLLCLTPDAVPDGADPYLLHRLSFFRVNRASPVLDLAVGDRLWLEERLDSMADELDVLDHHTMRVLGGILTEVLHRLDRLYTRKHGKLTGWQDSRVARFVDLVEERFSTTRRVEDYAQLLAISPAHLNHLTRRYLGRAPKALINDRVLLAARRLLAGSDLSIHQIALKLGFEDPSYFSRFFHRVTGFRPTAARELYRSAVSSG